MNVRVRHVVVAQACQRAGPCFGRFGCSEDSGELNGEQCAKASPCKPCYPNSACGGMDFHSVPKLSYEPRMVADRACAAGEAALEVGRLEEAAEAAEAEAAEAAMGVEAEEEVGANISAALRSKYALAPFAALPLVHLVAAAVLAHC